MSDGESGKREHLELTQAATYLLDECRMVLPGVQAIFGFQLVAVFSERFARDLDKLHQELHFLSLSMVALAAAMLMTPAAYHRMTRIRQVSERFVHTCSRLLLAAMIPLSIGLAIDYYVIGSMIFGPDGVAAYAGAGMLAVLSALWFFFPRSRRPREADGGTGALPAARRTEARG
jgi:hypothetical protein